MLYRDSGPLPNMDNSFHHFFKSGYSFHHMADGLTKSFSRVLILDMHTIIFIISIIFG